MKIILDTHIFLRAVAEPEKLSAERTEMIERLSNTMCVSAVTITEIMIKASTGKLQIAFDPVAIAKESGFELLDFSAEDASVLQTMPFHHKDPFARMLISQALNRKYALMSNNGKFGAYGCKLV